MFVFDKGSNSKKKLEFPSISNCQIECQLMLIQDGAQKDNIKIKHITLLSRSDDLIEEGNIIKVMAT